MDGVNVWMYVPGNSQVQVSTFLAEEKHSPRRKSIFEQYAGPEKLFTRARKIDGRVFDLLILPVTDSDEAAVTVWIDRG